MTRERLPILPLVLTVIGFAALAVSTVGGAMATNHRAAAAHRAEFERENRIATENSLDVAAIRRGRAEFLRSCTACHGPNGESKPNLGKDLRVSEFIAGKSDKQMVMFLKLGRGSWEKENTTGVAMPPKGGNPMLDDADLADLVQFIRFLQASRSEEQ